MRKIFVLLLLFLATTSFADQRAVTDTGEEVILYSDGKWQYVNEEDASTLTIQNNPTPFNKPEASSFMLKSTKNNSLFWINPEKWDFTKKVDNPAAEYEFKLKGKDLYGMAITEEIYLPIESFPEISLENSRDVSPDMKITKKEYRLVNGNKVIYIIMEGTVKGMKIVFQGYYYSDSSGTTQYVVYTSQDLLKKYNAEISNFLNGLDAR